MHDWVLRMGDRAYRLGKAGLTIGRAASSDIVLDGAQVSRRHARVTLTEDGVTVTDEGSSHGTHLNGSSLTAPRRCDHGDRIGIAGHTIFVHDQERRVREALPTLEVRPPSAPSRARPRIADEPETADFDVPSRVLAEAEAALARREEDAVTRRLGTLFELLDAGERANGADPDLLRRCATVALHAATELGRSEWIGRVVELHTHRRRLMDAATLEALAAAVERCGAPPDSLLVTYCASLKTSRAPRTPAEREDLARLAAIAERAVRRR